jgi:hypothetical protein
MWAIQFMWKYCIGTLPEYLTFLCQPHATNSSFKTSLIYHRRYIHFRGLFYGQKQRKTLCWLEVLEVFSLIYGQLYFASRCLTKCKPVHRVSNRTHQRYRLPFLQHLITSIAHSVVRLLLQGALGLLLTTVAGFNVFVKVYHKKWMSQLGISNASLQYDRPIFKLDLWELSWGLLWRSAIGLRQCWCSTLHSDTTAFFPGP